MGLSSDLAPPGRLVAASTDSFTRKYWEEQRPYSLDIPLPFIFCHAMGLVGSQFPSD